ncbi:MAG TPA: tRNA pseudouridine(38-40) synthase TruA [Desulfobulbus sp.]|nr:tRNA pseudouridine(38-40) synthase TruA [Desulfobulbus sp.]
MNDRTIRLLISFDGTAYKGWQRQPDAVTIQGVLEEKLSLICNEPIVVHGAGRTDAGVHALGMVAHFHTKASHPVSTFVRGLNGLLPGDIRIIQANDADSDFHSRFSAVAKTYRYDFFTGPILDPTRRLYETHFPGFFDSRAVCECLELVKGRHDFAGFEGTGSRDLTRQSKRGSTRTLLQANLTPDPMIPLRFSFFFTGDGFLRHMVRNIVGTLIPVGRGRMTKAEFGAVLNGRDRRAAGPTAPACGLFLLQIYYSRQELALVDTGT